MAALPEPSVSEWPRIEEKVTRTRADQGLPPKIEDFSTLQAIADLMRPGLIADGGTRVSRQKPAA